MHYIYQIYQTYQLGFSVKPRGAGIVTNLTSLEELPAPQQVGSMYTKAMPPGRTSASFNVSAAKKVLFFYIKYPLTPARAAGAHFSEYRNKQS